jgi:hypothetical protein
MRLLSLEIVLVAGIAAYLWYAHQDKASGIGQAAQTPMTYGEWAKNRAQECERSGGGGKWHSGLGSSLPDFCAALAQAEMQRRFCKDQPRKC